MMLNVKRVACFLDALKISFSFMSLLKRCYVVINELKRSVKKRELDQKYVVGDFENDLIMDEIDINSFMNENSSVETDS